MTSEIEIPKPTRREMLYYLGGASILLLAGESGALLAWFTHQRVSDEKLPVATPIDLHDVPTPQTSPMYIPEARCYLVNINNTMIALDAVCVFRPTIVKWVHTNNRYECPHCGSHFRLDGTVTQGPAPRNLDRLILQITTSHGELITSSQGDPVSLIGAESINVYKELKIQTKPYGWF